MVWAEIVVHIGYPQNKQLRLMRVSRGYGARVAMQESIAWTYAREQKGVSRGYGARVAMQELIAWAYAREQKVLSRGYGAHAAMQELIAWAYARELQGPYTQKSTGH
jgi:hypothetical protein